MAGAPRGLGRGLDALFKSNEEPAATGGTTPNTLPLRMLKPNPNQPRKAFAEEGLEELASSIRAQGVLQPLLVRPVKNGEETYYEIVAGERRWRASRMAGIREVPVIIREMTDLETLAVGLIENLQREDLNPMEEALGMQELKDKFGLSQEDLSQKLSKSRSSIANTLRLLQLSEAARAMLQNGTISAGHARTLLSVAEEVRDEMLERIIRQMLTVRQAEAMAQYWKAHGELPAHEGADGVKEAKAPRPAVILSPRMKDIHSTLSTVFSGKVAVSGTEEKGKVTLSFSSQDELNELLTKLGVTVNG